MAVFKENGASHLEMRVKQLCFAGEMEDDKAVALIHLIHDDFCPFIEGEDVGGLVKLHRLLVPCAHLSHVVIRWDVLYSVEALLAGGSYDWTRQRKQTSRCLCCRNGGEGE